MKGIAKDVSSMGGVKLGDTMDAVGTKKQTELSLNIKKMLSNTLRGILLVCLGNNFTMLQEVALMVSRTYIKRGILAFPPRDSIVERYRPCYVKAKGLLRISLSRISLVLLHCATRG